MMLKLMKALYDCGAITNEEIEKLNIDFSIVDKLLRKEQLTTYQEGKTVLFSLNDFGEKVYRINTDKKYFYRCSNLKKMKVLINFYASLTDDERDTWKSKDVWYNEGHIGSIPDATYLKDGKMYGVFVQTENTVKKNIENVERFVKVTKLENLTYLKEV